MKSRKTWSWRLRLLLLLLLFAVLPMFGIGVWSVQKLSSTFKANTLEALDAIVHARAAAIDQLIESRQRGVDLLASQVAPHVMRLKEVRAKTAAPAPQTPAKRPEPLREPTAPSEAPATPDAGGEQALDAVGDAENGHTDEKEPGGKAGGASEAAAEKQAGSAAPASDKKKEQVAPALAEARATLHQVLGLILWDQQTFEELLIIDETGEVLASTFDKHEGKTAKGIEYFENGLKATYVQTIFLSPITGQLTMVISTPIRDPNRTVVGVLAARLNLTRFFRLINDMTGLGSTGEIVVGKRRGDEVLFMAPTRHDAQAALQRTVKLGEKDGLPFQEAARGLEGMGLHRDYRGIDVLAAWLPVPSLRWGLVVKIDYEEAMQDVHAVQRQFVLVSLALLIVVIVAALVVSRELVRPLRDLKDAADKISRGDLDVQLEIRSDDEIGELADSFERMVAAIKFFREHARKADEDVEESSEVPAADR